MNSAEIWSEVAAYTADVAGVGKHAGRSVPSERLADMRAALRVAFNGDPDAFRAVINEDYATPAAQAVAQCVALRAEVEQERAALAAAGVDIGEDDPTPVTP